MAKERRQANGSTGVRTLKAEGTVQAKALWLEHGVKGQLLV